MDLERGNLEILFRCIPYYRITEHCMNPKLCHDYKNVNKELYSRCSLEMYPSNSFNEHQNRYDLLKQGITKDNSYGIFNLVFDAAETMLTYDGSAVKCRLEQMLRWREISFQLSQEFFTCAYLAKYDIERGYTTENFSWIPIIKSDDDRLQQILQKGIAENHFHLAGSTKIFELNWISLMNIISGRVHDFKKLGNSQQMYAIDTIYGDSKKESFYEECQRAALYRVYLFAKLRGDAYSIDRCEDIYTQLDRGRPVNTLVSDIQDIIYCEKFRYGAFEDDAMGNGNRYILDYALQKDMIAQNDNECRLLAGERRFLYECYRAVIEGTFNDFEKNLFYIYLSIRTHFRGELIQINRRVGFQNFSDYQDRKEIFIQGIRAYEYELIRLAVNEQLSKEYVKSLEARICPKKASLLYKTLRYQEQIIGKENFGRFFYVLHFPKSKDKGFTYLKPRNHDVRENSERNAKQVAKLLSFGSKYNHVIRGIDACSNEIGCRPETFAQIFRYLSDQAFHGEKLHMTYHAGEDFLDIVDGLRAIDEALLFCGLERGSRLGHALALGINAGDYYSYKNHRLVLPRQVLLDDIAWVLCKSREYGVQADSSLASQLEKEFYILLEEIFNQRDEASEHITVTDYYQSWMLRGDNPLLYLDNFEEFQKRLDISEVELYDRYRLNKYADARNLIRKTERIFKLYKRYHFDKKVRETGDLQTDWKVPEGYDRLVNEIQDSMIGELVKKGICIETNPSSNYLIGTIEKYDQHPVFRFNSRKLKPAERNHALCVSINTDDQGVFDTLLENEYALICLALRKAKDDKGGQLYDVEDIYEWLDYVREMGMEQVFKNSAD